MTGRQLLKAGNNLQGSLIYQYILSHLPFTCHGVAYCSGWWVSITYNGTMVLFDDNNLTNKRGTKTICCQIMALKFVNKTCDSPLNNLQI